MARGDKERQEETSNPRACVIFFRQLKLQMWKNAKILLRSPKWLAFEILPPILFILIPDERIDDVKFTTTQSLLGDDVSNSCPYQRDLNLKSEIATSITAAEQRTPNKRRQSSKTHKTQLLQPRQRPWRILYTPNDETNNATMQLFEEIISANNKEHNNLTVEAYPTEKAALAEVMSVYGRAGCPTAEGWKMPDIKLCNSSEILAVIVLEKPRLTTKSKQLKYRIRMSNTFYGYDFMWPYNIQFHCQPWPMKGHAYAPDKRFATDKWMNPGPRNGPKPEHTDRDLYLYNATTPSVYNANPDPKAQNRPQSGGVWAEDYYSIGFLTLQHAMDRALIQSQSNYKTDFLKHVEVNVQRMPHLAYKRQPAAVIMPLLIPTFLMFSLVISFLSATRNIIHEKEGRLKEYMLTMGLHRGSFWLSHFVFAFAKTSVIAFVLSGLMCTLSFGSDAELTRMLPKSDFSAVLCFMLLYVTSAVCHAFLISTIAQTGARANTIGLFFWVISVIPFIVVSSTGDKQSLGYTVIAGMFLNSGMAIGFDAIAKYELQGFGLQWSMINESITPHFDLTMLHISGILILQTVVCLVLTFYFDVVFPGGDTVPLKPYFFVQPSFWCTDRRKLRSHRDLSRLNLIPGTHPDVEPVPDKAQPSIVIKDLRKEFREGFFKRTTFTAVNGLNLVVLPNQITVLLGHNGAGKSTTFAMLTGIHQPTAGKATIAGFNVETELHEIRKRMGFCPQYNVLFDKLTVREHLIFFCKLKNREVDLQEIDNLIEKLTLGPKRDRKATSLSGGQKRKLSIGVALVGHSEVVMLDEPSSGVDPQTKHELWKLLMIEKLSRTILMTTHFMEEADILGDRIAIMTRGRLHCCGSGLFLKQKFGAGYHLTIVYGKQRREGDDTDTRSVLKAHCGSGTVQIEEADAQETTFSLPNAARPNFPVMFAELEKKKKQLNIVSFGVSVTTMEEVFLKVGHVADAKEEVEGVKSLRLDTIREANSRRERDAQADAQEVAKSKSGRKSDKQSIAMATPLAHRKVALQRLTSSQPLLRDLSLRLQQLRALWIKRGLYLARNAWGVFIFFGAFIIVFSGVTWWTTQKADVAKMPSKDLQMDMALNEYGTEQKINVYYNADDGGQPYSGIHEKYASQTTPKAKMQKLKTNNAHNEVQDELLADYKQDGAEWKKIIKKYIIGAMFQQNLKNDTMKLKATALFSGEPYHSLPISVNQLDTTLAQMALNDDNVKLTTINHPLPMVDKEGLSAVGRAMAAFKSGLGPGLILLLIGTLTGDMISRMPMPISDERRTGMKHLQFGAGVTPYTYWLSNFLFDYTMFMIIAVIVFCLLAIFDVSAWFYESVPLCYWLSFMLYGWAVIPHRYLMAFVIDEPTRVQMISNAISSIWTIVFFGIYGVLHVAKAWIIKEGPDKPLSTNEESLVLIHDIIQFVGTLIAPEFCFTRLNFDMYFMGILRQDCVFMRNKKEPESIASDMICVKALKARQGTEYFPWTSEADPLLGTAFWWEWGLGFPLLVLTLQGILFWGVIFYLDARIKTITIESYNLIDAKDEDVQREQKQVKRMNPLKPAVLARGLSLQYGKKNPVYAVRNVSFHVAKGECFGLLGVNGAGKTSTFRMLTGELHIQEGEAYIDGHCVNDDWQTACHQVGYCPQFEAVLECLTGRELIELFARLRGVPWKHVSGVVESTMVAVDIVQYANRPFKAYSGGTKRRCSLGVAVVALPSVLMLDEPTTGVDPVSKRSLWTILADMKSLKHAIVLTSHSMEECDVLCSRLVIMIAGQLRCIGSPQYLKTKFGTGFTLNIRMAEESQFDIVHQTLTRKFGDIICTSHSYTALSYSIPMSNNVTYSELFGFMQKMLTESLIVDYSLSQSSLEDVFLAFSALSSMRGSKPPPIRIQDKQQPKPKPMKLAQKLRQAVVSPRSLSQGARASTNGKQSSDEDDKTAHSYRPIERQNQNLFQRKFKYQAKSKSPKTQNSKDN